MSKIGKNVFIHPTSYIGDNVEIEDNVYIGFGCVIGSFAEHPHVETKEHGLIIIGKNTKLTKLVTIDCPLEPEGKTIIGENCYLMSGSHCGHDTILSDNVTLSCGVKVGGFTLIMSYCTLGLNSTTHQHSVLNAGTMLGANSFYKGEGEGMFKVWGGVPARVIGENWRLKEKLGI